MKKIYFLFIVFITYSNINAQCWTKVSSQNISGDAGVYAIHSNGSLWRWGGNYGNQPTLFNNTYTWVDISVGEGHVAGITSNGGLLTWGYNFDGELGDGTNQTRNYPQLIGQQLGWSKVSCGSTHTIAIHSNGTLWVWGNNEDGQLGIGSYQNKNEPVKVGTATNWANISAGIDHSLAIKTNGTLWGAGSDYDGQMGSASGYTHYTTFTQIGTHTDWNSISTKLESNLGLKSSANRIWVWGNNYYGQLGDGSTVQRNSPNYLDMQDSWISISSGAHHSGGINNLGKLMMWGRNVKGELGIGNTTQKLEPYQVGSATNWSKIYCGYKISFAIKTDGSLWSWGNNEYGYLGLGHNTDMLVPTLVPCPSLGLSEFTHANIKVYPNPVQDILYITNETDILITKVTISNVLGKVLMVFHENIEEVNIQQLKGGIYLLKIQSNVNEITHKIIKE